MKSCKVFSQFWSWKLRHRNLDHSKTMNQDERRRLPELDDMQCLSCSSIDCRNFQTDYNVLVKCLTTGWNSFQGTHKQKENQKEKHPFATKNNIVNVAIYIRTRWRLNISSEFQTTWVASYSLSLCYIINSRCKYSIIPGILRYKFDL